MGAIVAVANQKGGVGKTTLAVHLAAHCARAGQRVALVDSDAQGNATSWILDGDVSDSGLFRLLVVGEPLAQTLRTVNSWWNLRLLPGNSRTGEAMIFLAATGKPFQAIADALRPLADDTDLVIMDMPPSRAAGFRELLYATDWVVVPTQLERLSLEGVGFMAQTAQALVGQHGRGPRLLGIVPNMVRQTVEHRDQLQTLVRSFGQAVWPPIPLSVRVAEACAYGRTLFDYAAHDTVTAAMKQVAERFVENMRQGA